MDPLAMRSRYVLYPRHCRRERNGIPRYLRELESSQWGDRGQLADLQLRRLRALLAHAIRHSPYWRDKLAAADLTPTSLTGLADLRRLPTLAKRDLQRMHAQLRAPGHAGRYIADKTGGSTGEPVVFGLDAPRFYYRHAVAIRHDRWSGWELGDKTAYFWGHRRDLAAPQTLASRLRERFMDRQIVLDTSSLSAETLEAFRRRLLRFRPPLYVGYANAVYLFARYLEKRGGDYHRPQGVITSAEYLAPERRATIETVFGCRVFDRYGSRETGLMASQCEHGDCMHVADEGVLVEILRPDGSPAAPGERGRVVVTDLLNLGMPFIRYEIRDVAEPVAEPCACGRGLSRLRMAGGRTTDFLLARDGRMVSGASLTIFLIANARGVAQAQLVQVSRGEIRVRVVPGEGYGPDTAAWILDELPRYFGHDMTFAVDEVTEIPLAASGKHRFSICEFDPTEIF